MAWRQIYLQGAWEEGSQASWGPTWGCIGKLCPEVEQFPIAHIWAKLCFSFPLLTPNSCLLRYLCCPLANVLDSVSERTAPHPILDQLPAFLRSHSHSKPHLAFYILGVRLVWLCGDYLVSNFPHKCPQQSALSPNLDFFPAHHWECSLTSAKPTATLILGSSFRYSFFLSTYPTCQYIWGTDGALSALLRINFPSWRWEEDLCAWSAIESHKFKEGLGCHKQVAFGVRKTNN